MVEYAGPSMVVCMHRRYRNAASLPFLWSRDLVFVVILGYAVSEAARAIYAGGAMKPMYGCAGVEMDVPAARRLWRKS